jgi:hypothetical protein
MSKLAICLHGLVGNSIGKSCDSESDDKKILDLSYKHWADYIIGPQLNRGWEVDVFVHSWSVGLEQEIKDSFNPKLMTLEDQPEFEIPEYIRGTESRKHAHYCRWYSCKKSVELKSLHEKNNNFIYDSVMCARFDIAWLKKIIFEKHDQSKLWIPRWAKKKPERKLKDFWWFSSSKNIDAFATLFDHLGEYNRPESDCEFNVELGISSHYMMPHHLRKIGLPFGLVLEAANDWRGDCPLVRYKYFKAEE